MRFSPRLDSHIFDPRRPQGFVALPRLLLAPSPLLEPIEKSPQSRVPKRTRLWELSPHIHCSIIGTCLSTSELRRILVKAKLAAPDASDHELHGVGVQLAGQHNGPAKLVHKALDSQHRSAINRYAGVRSVEDVARLWREDVRAGNIPGGYWAAVTHPAATDALVRDIFGEVHMLSHLVGAANRADIRRLAALVAENAALHDKLARQQDRLHDAVVSRDARIRDLEAMLASSFATKQRETADAGVDREAALEGLIARLERRLQSEAARRATLEGRLQRCDDELNKKREALEAASRREAALLAELEAVERSLEVSTGGDMDRSAAPLKPLTVLYVGGRADVASHLRAMGDRLGVEVVQHDGGVDDRSTLLAGGVSRADVVMFPVDCVSHEAVLMVKKLCRQMSKPYLPLRSSGRSSFVAALRGSVVAALRSQASGRE